MEELNNSQQIRLAILYRIVQELGDSGKIRIQKTLYFLQEAFGVPSKYGFRMHHYGPYSEELETDLTRLKTTGYLSVRPDAQGYGFHVGVSAPQEDNWGPLVSRYDWEIKKVLSLVQTRASSELELMATLRFVDSLSSGLTDEELIDSVKSLKPKFTKEYISGFHKELVQQGLLGS